MRQNVALVTFNRGIVSPLALARVDAKQVALAAETQTNWLPRKLGPMSLRPGLGHIGGVKGNSITRLLPFAFAIGDTALIELTPGVARFWVNDELVSFPAVGTAITNGDFAVDLTGWTVPAQPSGTAAFTLGRLYLQSEAPEHFGWVYQQVAVPIGDQGVLHCLEVDVEVGACTVRVGSTLQGQEYIVDTAVPPGTTRFAFTPAGDFFIQLMSPTGGYSTGFAYVNSVALRPAGVLEVSTPFNTLAELGAVRIEQSQDVIFLASEGLRQQRIERRAGGAWSIVPYVSEGGPSLSTNTTTAKIGLYANVYGVGQAAQTALLSASDVFLPGHVGSVFRVDVPGQGQIARAEKAEVYTDWIKVTGAGTARNLNVNVDFDGGAVITVTLQRSVGEPGAWMDTATTYAVDTVAVYNDALDNQIIYYRLAVKAGGYTSGGVVMSMAYSGGQTPVSVLLTDYYDAKTVIGTPQGNVVFSTPTDAWYEGAWSGVRGYPSAVALNESRLCWAGKSKTWCSISDNYHGFDQDFEGDAGPISRSIGSGMVDSIRWLRSVGRLIAGGEGKEHSIRSSSLDEPLTPVNFNIKAYTSKGSSNVDAVTVDQSVIFVDRSGKRVQILSPGDGGNHHAVEATMLAAEVGEPGIIRLAVQQSPEIRVHCVRSDGKVAVLVYDQVEEVQAWTIVETDGIIEDAVALPAVGQDEMYYVVKRTINGAQVRSIEKWAHDADCVGGTVNKQADAFLQFANGVPSVTVTGLNHLIGAQVVCWADGQDQGVFTVSAGGTITLPSVVTAGVVGLYYRAQFKGVKLAHAAQGGTALAQSKRVDHLALILANTHYQGLRYGPDFDTLDDLPLVEEGAVTPANTMWTAYDQESVEFNGIYDTDARICLEAAAPRPCTVMAAIITMKTNDKL
jgi:hypothetical protein